MTCPKCGGEMRRYERNGVDIDQCTECRGIFLDRGELERLTDAETGYYAAERTREPASSGGRSSREPASSGGRSSGGHRGGGHGRRKKSFLDELFD
jgi:uncharacterized protein